jgi:hypothetical protein
MAMRSRHILAIVAVLAAGVAIKWMFFANRTAEAQSESASSTTMDVFQMQRDSKDLPALEIKDPI